MQISGARRVIIDSDDDEPLTLASRFETHTPSKTNARAVSPAAGDKHSCSPSDDDSRPAQAQRVNNSSRAKAADFDDVTQEILSLAISLYRCWICTDTAFPDHLMETDWVREAWSAACRELDVNIELTPTLSKLVRVYSSMHVY